MSQFLYVHLWLMVAVLVQVVESGQGDGGATIIYCMAQESWPGQQAEIFKKKSNENELLTKATRMMGGPQ